jgi:hypothetical protein
MDKIEEAAVPEDSEDSGFYESLEKSEDSGFYESLGKSDVASGMVFEKEPLLGTALMPPQFQSVLALLPQGAVIAGGYLLDVLEDRQPKDMDVFFTDAGAPAKLIAALVDAGYVRQDRHAYGCQEYLPPPVYTDPPAAGVVPVQLVLFHTYASPELVLDNFDFTVCQLGMDGKFTYAGATSLADMDAKRLVLHKLGNGPGKAYARMLRYYRKGYVPTLETLTRLAPPAGT